MQGRGAGTPGQAIALKGGPWWLPLTLAFALALLPLPLPTLAVHSSAPSRGAEGGMGAPVLVLAEAGVRLPAPTAGVLLLLPHALVATRWVQVRLPRRYQSSRSTRARRTRLVALGRLMLEGG